MKTIYFTATSLDGYIADSEHSLDWLFQFEDAEESDFASFMRDVGAIAMGSHTYEWLLRHYVYEDPDAPKAWPHEQPTWVFTSRSLRPVEGADITFVSGDVAPVFEDVREAAAGGDIWLAGGGNLAAQFHEQGLLDELIVTIAPVLLGGGAPLFTGRIVTPPLRVLAVRPQAGGMTEMRLAVERSS